MKHTEQDGSVFTQQIFLDVITEWKHKWMDVKGTDERDRENYNRRAFGVDANMKYSLARMIMKKINPPALKQKAAEAGEDE